MTTDTTVLAIDGGRPVASGTSPSPAWPRFSEEDIETVAALMRSGKLTEMADPGLVYSIETDLALACGVRYGLLTNSGTAALHCAFAGLGITPGQEVVVPALSYIACAAAVIHHQGVPVFADVDPLTYNLTPETVAPVLTERTRAVVVVHLHGLPADIEAIRRLTAPRGIAIVEDFSQAFGATIEGRPVGGFGDVGVASLMSGKNLPAAGEAGVLVTNDLDLRNRAARLKCFAHAIEGPGWLSLIHDSMGWNYRPSLLAVAVLPNQLFSLPEYTAVRREQAARLNTAIAAVPGCSGPVEPAGVEHAYHMYRFHFDPVAAGGGMTVDQMREAMRRVLDAEGLRLVEFQNAPLSRHALFTGDVGYGGECPWRCNPAGHPDYGCQDFPGALTAIRRSLVLGAPSQAAVCSPEVVDKYVAAFAKIAGNFDRFVAFARTLPPESPPWAQPARLF